MDSLISALNSVPIVGLVFQFSNLLPGSYTVRLGMTTNLSVTLQDVGSDDTIDSDINPTTRSVAVTTWVGVSVKVGTTLAFCSRVSVYVPISVVVSRPKRVARIK